MSGLRRARLLVVPASLCLLFAHLLRAQVDRTVITGTVTDQQGNRVPQCSVRATGTATGFEREALTTSSGTYELSGVPPGVYSVRFFKTGFSARIVRDVSQVVGQTRTLDVHWMWRRRGIRPLWSNPYSSSTR